MEFGKKKLKMYNEIEIEKPSFIDFGILCVICVRLDEFGMLFVEHLDD